MENYTKTPKGVSIAIRIAGIVCLGLTAGLLADSGWKALLAGFLLFLGTAFISET